MVLKCLFVWLLSLNASYGWLFTSKTQIIQIIAQFMDVSEGEKNTRRGGWIVLRFSSFSPKLKDTDQKQFKNSFWSDVQN